MHAYSHSAARQVQAVLITHKMQVVKFKSVGGMQSGVKGAQAGPVQEGGSWSAPAGTGPQSGLPSWLACKSSLCNVPVSPAYVMCLRGAELICNTTA